jgi:tetrahydromethanopterin S-methyltransferase subunit H
MTWNLRFVILEDKLTLEPYMELREVFYDEMGKPIGHARATVGGDNMEEITQYLDWALEATTKPVLQHKDFEGKL